MLNGQKTFITGGMNSDYFVIAARTGGGIEWLSDGLPSFRRVRPDRIAAGRGWMGLVANRDYRVASIVEAPLLPPLAVLILGIGALMLAWRREGR